MVAFRSHGRWPRHRPAPDAVRIDGVPPHLPRLIPPRPRGEGRTTLPARRNPYRPGRATAQEPPARPIRTLVNVWLRAVSPAGHTHPCPYTAGDLGPKRPASRRSRCWGGTGLCVNVRSLRRALLAGAAVAG